MKVSDLMGYLCEYDENDEVQFCVASTKMHKGYDTGTVMMVDDAVCPLICIEVESEYNLKKQ